MTKVSAASRRAAQTAAMIETIEAWRCVGCGRLQAERPCVGICTDRRVELVEAQTVADLAWRVERLEAALALIARVMPKESELMTNWLALQARARALLDEA
ncbi:hypothetical protein EBB59_07585 [Lysobacter pythonis]|uniref:Uncharacterized protein n=1 Tax=Solilutibacter pythonis TaxID=2483112 RepID=A0A3M2HZG9_9GAMM|nr:hypothetical protein [Lysobacter pythonis]RMH92819.1 hypothetical protein EBB59_07585 [Lysobacter pythonis]